MSNGSSWESSYPPPSQSYHAFWTTDASAGWMAAVTSQASSWLIPKFNSSLDLTVDGVTRGRRGNKLQVRRYSTGHETALRFVMDETNQGGHFTTALTAVESSRGDGWISLDVNNDRGGFVNVPKLAGWLLDVLPLSDGAQLTASPRVIHMSDLADVLDLLQSPSRHGAVFLAATDERMPFDKFASRYQAWTKEVVGLGQTLVLDPTASVALANRVNEAWATPPWTIRTYLPSIDLASSDGARASRFLGTNRLSQESDSYIARLLGGVARRVISDRPTPSSRLVWARRFDRLDVSAATRAVVPTRPTLSVKQHTSPISVMVAPSDLSSARTEVERLRSEIMRVQHTLNVSSLSDANLLELLELATAERIEPEAMRLVTEQVDRLQDLNDKLSDELEVAKLDRLFAIEAVENAEKELGDQQRRLSYLTRSLVEINRADLAYGGTPPERDPLDLFPSEPLDYEQLLVRLSDLEAYGLSFTGDPRVTLDLQELDTDGKALQRAWEASVSLADYLRAKKLGDASGSVHKFLEDQPIGYRHFPVTMHAATETKYTKDHFGDERLLHVPETVSDGGMVVMLEHFKLARINRQDPRMYYFDDSSRSGIIYIGYIGPHMTNGMTRS